MCALLLSDKISYSFLVFLFLKIKNNFFHIVLNSRAIIRKKYYPEKNYIIYFFLNEFIHLALIQFKPNEKFMIFFL